jgi:hypothetical protein
MGVFYAFLDEVLIRFDVPTKELTNKGMKFQKEFPKLCEHLLINHRTISHDRSKADDLVEIMVQIMKSCLQKNGL